MSVTESACNPYAAPQAPLTVLPRARFNTNDSRRFSWQLVLQSLRTGASAGLLASLAMLFVFALRMGVEARGELPHLLMICGWFVAAASTLGLFWGLNHAAIVWCLMRWPPKNMELGQRSLWLQQRDRIGGKPSCHSNSS